MKQGTLRAPDRVPVVVGIILLAAAAIVAMDANHIQSGFTYGISPAAVPFVVAGFLALLGAGHLVVAFRRRDPADDSDAWNPGPADWKAVSFVLAGLGCLMAAIAAGVGFISGSALLFALTARAFGRRAFVVDLAIGAVLALLVFLLFNNLLSLTLPEGPIERLF